MTTAMITGPTRLCTVCACDRDGDGEYPARLGRRCPDCGSTRTTQMLVREVRTPVYAQGGAA